MATPIQLRPSYAKDASFLARLKQAVEKDERLTRKLKAAILSNLDGLSVALIHADIELRRLGDLIQPQRLDKGVDDS